MTFDEFVESYKDYEWSSPSPDGKRSNWSTQKGLREQYEDNINDGWIFYMEAKKDRTDYHSIVINKKWVDKNTNLVYDKCPTVFYSEIQ
jgi:hypothetical protein